MSELRDLEPFEADATRIIASKMEFVADGGSFLYLRKGEAMGAIEVATFSALLSHPYVTSASEALVAIGAAAATVGGAIVAFNKAWALGNRQLEKLVANFDRSKQVYAQLAKRIDAASRKALPSGLPVPKDFRVVCTPTKENEKAIPILRALGVRLRHRPKKTPSGSHRFHVNDTRFVLHVRGPGDRFLGVTGSHTFMRERLRADFLEEWEQCGQDVH